MGELIRLRVLRVVASTQRLAAVMFTDVAGYTASTQTNEAGALILLQEHEPIVRPFLPSCQEREFKSTDDGRFDRRVLLRRAHRRNDHGAFPDAWASGDCWSRGPELAIWRFVQELIND